MSLTESPLRSIRTERNFPLPSYVKDILQKLGDAGHVAYLVGGCVRDFILNRECKDIDIATSALPDELCDLFPKAITVGKSFGVIKVQVDPSSPFVEIATFRQDLEYQDYRHPKGVVFSGPREDASRRDFTLNALFYDPKTSRILDFTGGVDDLRLGVLRAIGDPSARFKEDPLRLLRAIRFKTRLSFRLDPLTAAAIQARAKLISKVSAERIRDELTLLWTGPRPDEALSLLSELGLLRCVLPEVEAIREMSQKEIVRKEGLHFDIWKSLLKTLRLLDEQSPVRSAVLSWVAILHEIGKPAALQANEGRNFNGHELEGAKLAENIAQRLKMTKDESKSIGRMVGDHLKFKDVFFMREATLQRFIRQEYFEELLAFHKADAMASDGNLAFYEFCSSRLEAMKKSPPTESYKLIDGGDLIQMGFSPGPQFSEIIRVIEDLALEGTIRSKEEALDYVLKYFVK